MEKSPSPKIPVCLSHGLKSFIWLWSCHSAARSPPLSTETKKKEIYRSVCDCVKPLLAGQLEYGGMNSLDGGLCYRIISAIIELRASKSYSDCNGSDGWWLGASKKDRHLILCTPDRHQREVFIAVECQNSSVRFAILSSSNSRFLSLKCITLITDKTESTNVKRIPLIIPSQW